MTCFLDEGTYIIQNYETMRYLYMEGERIEKRGDEGGWLEETGREAPPAVGAYSNFYNRTYWRLLPQGEGKYLIENVETRRFLFQSGPKITGDRGDENGWQESTGFEAPPVVGADDNYEDRAYWRFLPVSDNKYFIENIATQRYMLQDGEKLKGNSRREEGRGWSRLKGPPTLGADANYFNRAYWRLYRQ
ncbi:hypothetical protein ABFA07_001661 [Porites harrisoni]